LDRLDATPISGTEGAIFPFFSPDGEWIAFFSYGDGKFKTVSSRGGAPVPLFDASDLRGASWGPDGTIVFTPGVSAGISRISATGGTPQILTTPDAQKGERSHRFPQLLPGGKFLIFTLETNDLRTFDDAQIVLQSLETGERRTLVHGGSDARYSSSGHLVYARAGTLVAVPFDLTGGQVTGPPATVLERVQTNPGAGNGQYAFSETGSLVYVPGTGQSPSFRLVGVDRSGMARPLLERAGVYYDPKLSPDGRRLMVAVGGADDQLWSVDVIRGTLTRFTVEPGDHSGGIWTPDGKRVVFSSNRGGPFNLFWKLADGTGSEERLTMSRHGQWPHAVTPDGALLVFDQVEPTTRSDIWVLPLHGAREPRPLVRSRFNEWGGTLSPDGKWLAFISDESGRDELYVQAFPSAGEKSLVSKEGGVHPRWAGNGELFYRAGNRLMVVAVSASSSFRSEEPRLLFAGMYDNPNVHPYDVTADGKQVVMLQRNAPAEPTPIVVVQGWLNQVRQRAQ
jgi:serine/threonine-protein kinase